MLAAVWIPEVKTRLDSRAFKVRRTHVSKTTGLAENTIKNWGKDFQNRPKHILDILEKDHIIRLIQETPSVTDLTLTDIEPWEYCVYWINSKEPDQRGFRSECIRELTKATFGYYKFRTINNWGTKFENCPEVARILIKVHHHLKLMQQMIYVLTIPSNQKDREVYEKLLNYVNFALSIRDN